ncbi:MAG: hypothetical protein ABJB85_10745 [Nitrososphaerota archaeon]
MSEASEDASPNSTGGANICEACRNGSHAECLIANCACMDPSHEAGV